MSVAPNLTEMLFAAGAADQVVAVSAFSDYPEAAKGASADRGRLPPRLRAHRRACTDSRRRLGDRHAGRRRRTAGRPRHPCGVRIPTRQARRHRDRRRDARRPGGHARPSQSRRRGTSARASRRCASTTATGRGSASSCRSTARRSSRSAVRTSSREIVELCGGANVFADSNAQALPVDLESVLVRAPEVILSVDDADPVPFWARFTALAAVARGNVYRAPADLLARPSPRIAEGAADVCARLDEARAKPARVLDCCRRRAAALVLPEHFAAALMARKHAREHEQQVGQPVQVLERLRLRPSRRARASRRAAPRGGRSRARGGRRRPRGRRPAG